MALKVKKAADYRTIVQIMELDEDKYMVVSVVNRKQLGALYEVFEPLAREWRGQYQAMARAIANAYLQWKSNNPSE
jgi:hypothetical protein